MKNEVPAEYLSNVIERPDHIDSRSKYALLAQTLKVIDGSKALQFAVPELHSKFGKYGLASIKTNLKRYGLRVSSARKNGTVFIWAKEMKNA